MNKNLRTLAKKLIPKSAAIAGWRIYCQMKARRARHIFDQAPPTPAWLGEAELEALQNNYPLEPVTYGYDPQSIEKRSWERAHQLIDFAANSSQPINRFLDLGCWDGMLCYALEQLGKTAVGIDIRSEGFAPQAMASNVQLLQMNVEQLAFAPNSFDMVFSYNSFEHFPNPEATLAEALRVVRPGGYIYLDFGPLYLSPKGAHQFHAITVPYCQCLFPESLLSSFAAKHGLELTEFFWMNQWSISDFRQLWQKYSQHLEPVTYYETYNADHVDLIARYPGCFKSKTAVFDDLIVAYIEGLFRKIG
jgi:SAM-dependent methyltransferase